MSLWSKLDRYPPVLIRLLAKNPDGTAMTDDQIGRHIDPALVGWLSLKTNWSDVPVQHARSFISACRADLGDRNWVRRTNRYVKPDSNAKFTHLVNSPEWPRFKRLLAIYVSSIT